MNNAIATELQFFLISILWGVIILFVYDFLRIFHRIIKHNTVILAIEDIIFWVIASVFIFAMIYNSNNGIIRGFSVIGVSLGMVFYHYTISDFIVNSITRLIKLLLTPFTMAIKMVKRFYCRVRSKIRKIRNFIFKRLKKHLDSFKIAVNTKKQKRAVKRKQLQEQRALEKQKKQELYLQKNKAKLEEKQKLAQAKNAKKKPSKKRNAPANAEADNRVLPQKNLSVEKRRPVELSLHTTTGNRVEHIQPKDNLRTNVQKRS
ncbi:MAG: spore cortex biosynthesis protein YabQ [Mobilitalea sp.]